MPRPVVSKLASVGSECEPKIASLERNKRDVAPRTQRHVREDRHDYGFHGRGLSIRENPCPTAYLRKPFNVRLSRLVPPSQWHTDGTSPFIFCSPNRKTRWREPAGFTSPRPDAPKRKGERSHCSVRLIMRTDGRDHVRFGAHSGLGVARRYFRKVLIVLQNSFCANQHKFSRPYTRRSNNDLRGYIVLR
jgi:hypothetical protein